jgi:rubredoxin
MEKEPLFNNKCPKCGSDKLDYSVMTPQEEIILQDVKCENCGYEFGIYATTKWYLSEINESDKHGKVRKDKVRYDSPVLNALNLVGRRAICGVILNIPKDKGDE